MATGDLDNNLERLRSEMGKAKFPARQLDGERARAGDPGAFLPLLHHVLLNYSKPFAKLTVQGGYELTGKTDLRFVEAVLKLLREEFNYKASLSVNQFLSKGFAERKMLLTCDVAGLVRERHAALVRPEGRPSKRRPAKPATSAHIWGSPVEKSVQGIVHRSPPVSASPKPRRKKAMNRTPQHLRGRHGQIEMVPGEEVPVEVVRANWAAPLPEASMDEETEDGEDVPRKVLPVFNGSFAGWAQQPESSSPVVEVRPAVPPPMPRIDSDFEGEEEEEEEAAEDGSGAQPEAERHVVLMPAVRVEDDSPKPVEVAQYRGEGPGVQALVESLRQRLEAAEARISAAEQEGAKERQGMQARITILEGRVRFLEGALEEASTSGASAASKAAVPYARPGPAVAAAPGNGAAEPGRATGAEAGIFPRGFRRAVVDETRPVSSQVTEHRPPPADGATDDFISKISNRFEAARALLDTM